MNYLLFAVFVNSGRNPLLQLNMALGLGGNLGVNVPSGLLIDTRYVPGTGPCSGGRAYLPSLIDRARLRSVARGTNVIVPSFKGAPLNVTFPETPSAAARCRSSHKHDAQTNNHKHRRKTSFEHGRCLAFLLNEFTRLRIYTSTLARRSSSWNP